MSLVLLLLVLMGFAPTFYLRALFDVPPIQAYLYIHGAILTGWFLLLVIQPFLVVTGQVAQHQRLGAIGGMYGLLVVAGGLIAALGLVSNRLPPGIDLDADASSLGFPPGVTITEFAATIVWGNISSLVSFGALLSSAIFLRRRPEAHKRLILLASLCLIGPALTRVMRSPIFGGEQGAVGHVLFLLLFATLFLYDFRSRRHIHAATALGSAFALVMLYAGGPLMASTQIGQALIRVVA